MKWRESYKPISVSENFQIIPSWYKKKFTSKAFNKLYIYPGMGFGTGSHETTFLCMQLLLKTSYSKPGLSCLDFGCGSGILGIGLKLLQSQSHVDLYDIDKEALNNCVQNIELNDFNLSDFSLLLPKHRDKFLKQYDVVFANILKNVLELEVKYLAHSVLKGGALILSGLLKEQEVDIVSLYLTENSQLELVEVSRSGDWIAILFKQL